MNTVRENALWGEIEILLVQMRAAMMAGWFRYLGQAEDSRPDLTSIAMSFVTRAEATTLWHIDQWSNGQLVPATVSIGDTAIPEYCPDVPSLPKAIATGAIGGAVIGLLASVPVRMLFGKQAALVTLGTVAVYQTVVGTCYLREVQPMTGDRSEIDGYIDLIEQLIRDRVKAILVA